MFKYFSRNNVLLNLQIPHTSIFYGLLRLPHKTSDPRKHYDRTTNLYHGLIQAHYRITGFASFVFVINLKNNETQWFASTLNVLLAIKL